MREREKIKRYFCPMDPFYIKLRRNSKDLRILVKQTHAGEKYELYSVIGKNKTIVVQNNRPIWLIRQVRHRMEWSLVEGAVPYASNLDEICNAIEAHIKKR